MFLDRMTISHIILKNWDFFWTKYKMWKRKMPGLKPSWAPQMCLSRSPIAPLRGANCPAVSVAVEGKKFGRAFGNFVQLRKWKHHPYLSNSGNRHWMRDNEDSWSLISRGDVFIYEVEQFYVPQNVLLPLGKQRYRQRPPRLPQCHVERVVQRLV